MKWFMIGLLALAPAVTMAKSTKKRKIASESLECTLRAGKGAFSKFQINGSKLTFDFTSEVGGGDKEPTTMQRKKLTNTDDARYSYQIGDWASGSIYVATDDDGTAAFVTFGSDGPALTGYYRCK